MNASMNWCGCGDTLEAITEVSDDGRSATVVCMNCGDTQEQATQ